MTPIQKLIKYLAIGLAIVLIFSIFSAIVGFFGMFGAFKYIQREHTGMFQRDYTTMNFSQTYEGITSLDVIGSIGDIEIQTGDKFAVEAQNVSDRFTCTNNSGTLVLNDKTMTSGNIFNFFNQNKNTKIIVYLPQSFNAKNASFKFGAAKVTIYALSCDNLNLEMGAGKLAIHSLVANSSRIIGGAGDVEINKARLTDLEFKSGVGATKISGAINGNSDIICGIGETVLNLDGSPNDYNINARAGIGSVYVNGSTVSNSYANNINAKNNLKIQGGVGEVRVNFN